MAHASDPGTLTLHAVRLLGYADVARIAGRFDQDAEVVGERLLDFEAFGLVQKSSFDGDEGWSLTEPGRAQNERLLSEELEQCGARQVVADVHARFLPLNARFQDAVTRWQVRPMPGTPLATNDHTDHRWDGRVIDSLSSVGRRLAALGEDLAEHLGRFSGYADRYTAAADRVARGEKRWVDGLGIDSCHTVWMQLHEDLLATLGLDRSGED